MKKTLVAYEFDKTRLREAYVVASEGDQAVLYVPPIVKWESGCFTHAYFHHNNMYRTTKKCQFVNLSKEETEVWNKRAKRLK